MFGALDPLPISSRTVLFLIFESGHLQTRCLTALLLFEIALTLLAIYPTQLVRSSRC